MDGKNLAKTNRTRQDHAAASIPVLRLHHHSFNLPLENCHPGHLPFSEVDIFTHSQKPTLFHSLRLVLGACCHTTAGAHHWTLLFH